MLLYNRLSAKCKISKIFRLILHCNELLFADSSFMQKLLFANNSFVLVVFKMLKIKVFCLLFILFD